jgi:uncharacterized caspase-like protein
MYTLLAYDNMLVQAASGSKRLALIFGNSIYGENFSLLENPENDARAMEERLNSLGFAVDDALSVNRSYFEMLNDIEVFTKRIHEGATDIVFYYAGHGCSISKYPKPS